MIKYIVSFLLIVLLIIFIIGYFVGENILISKYKFSNSKISNSYKIVHLTDIHNATNSSRNKEMTEKVNSLNADIIFFTGDIIDDINHDHVIDLINSFNAKYKIYISGNHEYDLDKKNDTLLKETEYNKIVKKLEYNSVIVLNDESVLINNEINVIGIKDYASATLTFNQDKFDSDIKRINDTISENIDEKYSNIVLMHRPHYFSELSENNIDYFFSGHVHGGQFEDPFQLVGLVGPDQGLFPKYFAGLYEENNSKLFLSRGLEFKDPIPRLYNPREIIYLEIN